MQQNGTYSPIEIDFLKIIRRVCSQEISYQQIMSVDKTKITRGKAWFPIVVIVLLFRAYEISFFNTSRLSLHRRRYQRDTTIRTTLRKHRRIPSIGTSGISAVRLLREDRQTQSAGDNNNKLIINILIFFSFRSLCSTIHSHNVP
jgi:hypothetical protein